MTQAERWHLRLYVAGESPKARRARANLRAICEERLEGNYEIEEVDLLAEPHRARTDGIFAVPTLVRHRPEPVAHIIGDLSDTGRVLAGLDLD